jgi:LPXTG-motif cell wall-anchored protein
MWGSIIVVTAVPEFSSSFVVVVGMLVIALGLMLIRKKV